MNDRTASTRGRKKERDTTHRLTGFQTIPRVPRHILPLRRTPVRVFAAQPDVRVRVPFLCALGEEPPCPAHEVPPLDVSVVCRENAFEEGQRIRVGIALEEELCACDARLDGECLE